MTTRREMIKGGIAATAICAGGGIPMSYGNVHSLLGARGMSLISDAQGSEEITLPYLIFNIEKERNGSRYFNTGVVPDSNTRAEFLMGRNDDYTIDFGGWQSGCRTGWISEAFMVNFGPKNGLCWIIYNYGTQMQYYPVDPNFEAVFISFDASGTLIAGDTVIETHENLSLADNAFYIGDVNENGIPKGGSDNQGCGKMYWCKLYRENTLIKHYVPAQQNGEAILHELVSDTYLQSSGTFAASTIAYGEETIRLINDGKIAMEQWPN